MGTIAGVDNPGERSRLLLPKSPTGIKGLDERRRESVDALVAALRADFDAEEGLARRLIEASVQRQEAVQLDRLAQGRRRTVEPAEKTP